MPKRFHYKNSLPDLLIATLASGRNLYLYKAILRERRLQRYKKENIGVALGRLSSRGLVQSSSKGWFLTNKGKDFRRSSQLLDYFPSPFNDSSSPNTIIAFDIPEKRKHVRNWLRNQIKIFGYKMLQQSLWIGPGPLPEKFLKRLEDLKIRKNIKTFRINRLSE
jgi:DNA-binding transcriptional regulator PaaX